MFFQSLIVVALFIGVAAMIGQFLRKRKVVRWLRRNLFESDQAFLDGCGVSEDRLAQRIAIAIRQNIATLAEVPQTSIPARARLRSELHDELGICSADWIDVIWRVQRELKVEIDRAIWRGLPPEAELCHLIQGAIAAGRA